MSRFGGRDDRRRPPRDLMRERMPERRRRSITPPDRFGYRGRGSPPLKRHRGEDFYDDSPPSRDRRYWEPMERERPWGNYPEDSFEREERERSKREMPFRGPGRRDRKEPGKPGPMSFKEYMMNEVDDDCDPEEAKKRYNEYLSQVYGSEIKAEFEQKKDQEALRNRFDPRVIEKRIKRRQEEAWSAADDFRGDFEKGRLNPQADNFNQGAGTSAPKMPSVPEDAGLQAYQELSQFVSPAAWALEVGRRDYAISRALMVKLDKEKAVSMNPLIEAEQDEEEEKPEDTQLEENFAVEASTMSLEQVLAKVDQQASYLWRVHALDYYAAAELPYAEYGQQKEGTRKLRGPQPPEDLLESDAGRDLVEQHRQNVQKVWRERIEQGDPAEEPLQKARVERDIEGFINDQIVPKGEGKWGNKLSEKLFVDRKFVVKHIRSKHQHVLNAERERIQDDVYYDNFRKAREVERQKEREESQAEAARQQQAAASQQREAAPQLPTPPTVQNGAHSEQPSEIQEDVPMEEQPGFEGAPPGAPMGMRPPSMRMRRVPMRPPAFMPQMPMPYMPLPPQMMMGMGMPMPRPMMPINPRMGMVRPRIPRQRVGPDGMFIPVPGAKMHPQGIKEYWDLDDPSNNRRQHLDYGDI